MSEKCEHKWKYYCLSKVIHCELCETDALKYIKQIDKQNSSLQSKCDELEKKNKIMEKILQEVVYIGDKAEEAFEEGL